MRERLKPYTPYLLVSGIIMLLIVLILGVVAFLRNLDSNTGPSSSPTPFIEAPAVLPTPAFNTTSAVKNTSIVWRLPEDISLPASAQVYGVTSYELSEERINEIVSTFPFSEPPQNLPDARGSIIYLYRSPDKNTTLLLNQTTGYIEFGREGYQGKPDVGENFGKDTSNDNQVITLARNFIEEHNLAVSLNDLKNPRVEYLADTHESDKSVSRKDALVFRVTFQATVNGREIVLSQASGSYFVVDIDVYGTVRKAVAQLPPILATNKTVTLISLDEAIKRATSGEGVISLESTTYPQPLPETINSVIITSAQIAYFDDHTSPFIQPIVLFSGILPNDETNKEAYIYLNAAEN